MKIIDEPENFCLCEYAHNVWTCYIIFDTVSMSYQKALPSTNRTLPVACEYAHHLIAREHCSYWEVRTRSKQRKIVDDLENFWAYVSMHIMSAILVALWISPINIEMQFWAFMGYTLEAWVPIARFFAWLLILEVLSGTCAEC